MEGAKITYPSRRSTEKIDEFDKKEEKAFGIIERAKAQGDIYNLSYGASLLQNCGKKKTDDPMWRQEDYSYLADHILTAKQIIIPNFSTWLVNQRPANCWRLTADCR